MKKISVIIENKKYDISLDNRFSKEIEREIISNFDTDSNNELKTLLSAYLNKCYEYNTLLESVKDIYEKIKKSDWV